MDLISSIMRGWSWTGIKPALIVGENDFGNLIIRDEQGLYWRLCPEELTCEVIAKDQRELNTLFQQQDFLCDWHMASIVEGARNFLGDLKPSYKYCLKTPSLLGGEYIVDNFGVIPIYELIESSGVIAAKIDGLPDGTEVKITVVD